ncbi:hypothetical protein Pint_11177 [Pistacia integerrima]|uniref:Uncharacterized protein n=1 Tax=Pistacia integerrima TaxID=434235 RepID=A0ACC0XI45_9ROSI|nr:hypothetical protein Pint_11177 [Pistacia integerrima]
MFSSFVGSQVLLTSCKVMAPFTPFFTEVLYQNMRKVCKESEDSINFCRVPEEEGKLCLWNCREMIVVHPDTDFLDDITGKLREYVLEELNVRSLVPCNHTLKYASLRAEPDFSVLGKRLGKSMGVVAKEVKAMTQGDILAFEKGRRSNYCYTLFEAD